MATETTNYKMTKPAQDDYYDVEVFNNKFDIVDAELKKHSDSFADVSQEIKASADDVAAMISMVRLGKYSSEDGSVNASFDLSGINVSDYSEFNIWIGGMSETGINLYLRINNDSGANYISGQTKDQNCLSIIAGSNSSYYDAAKISLFCGESRIHVQMFARHYNSTNGLVGYSTDYGAYMACGGSGLKSIQLYTEDTNAQGAEIILYGIRK